MQNGNTWELPFSDPAELELHTDWGSLSIMPVEAGAQPRLDLVRGSTENVDVVVEKHGDVVRVALEPHGGHNWFGSWECHVNLYVPRNVRAHIQTSAGSISARDLEGCELGIKANAGKIDLTNVHGLLHLGADAGSVTGRDVGGTLDVETQAGSVRLDVTELRPGEHRVRAMMGSVRLELARGLDVSIETRTSLGSVRNRYPSNASAAAKLLLSTEMGEVRVDGGDFSSHTSSSSVTSTSTTSTSSTSRSSKTSVSSSSSSTATASEPRGPVEKTADPELERILKMVESGEISAQEADELLQAMGRV
jgi:DUF4097 and DUF4098 domain-containing protein YvlB